MKSNSATSTRSMPFAERLWELLRRNPEFKADAKSLLEAVRLHRARKQEEILKGVKEGYAKVALRWILPPENPLSAGPKKFMTRSINMDQPWSETPARFRAQFKEEFQGLNGLDATRKVNVELVDAAKLARTVRELHECVAAGNIDTQDLGRRLFSLRADLSRLSRRKVFALEDVCYYEGRIEGEIVEQLKSHLRHSKKRKSHPTIKDSFLATPGQWKLFFESEKCGKLFATSGSTDTVGHVQYSVKKIRKLRLMVYPAFQIPIP